MYEPIEHTADVGLRVRAGSLDGLLAEAGRGLFALIVAHPERIEPRRTVRFELAADAREDLLHDWLSELLFTFETRHIAFARFDVRVNDHSLRATGHGEPFDPHRHGCGHEVKAITYHELKVERTDDGWLAEVIVDI